MHSVLNCIKYAVVETPSDFTSYVISSFSSGTIDKPKTLADRISLLATGISIAEIFGYTHSGLKKFTDYCTSFKVLSGAVNFIPSAMADLNALTVVSANKNSFESAEFSALTQVVNFAKNFFTNFKSFLTVIDKCSLPISAGFVSMTGAVGGVLSGVSSTFGLADDLNKLAKTINMTPYKGKYLDVIANVYSIIQKVVLIAASVLGAIGLFVATSVFSVPMVATASLYAVASLSGLFGKYVTSCAEKVAKSA